MNEIIVLQAYINLHCDTSSDPQLEEIRDLLNEAMGGQNSIRILSEAHKRLAPLGQERKDGILIAGSNLLESYVTEKQGIKPRLLRRL